MAPAPSIEDLLRRMAPEVLGAVVRRYGHFDLAEDAVQEALLTASRQWSPGAIPESPRGWLITVASRRLIDLLRADASRREREHAAAQWALVEQPVAPAELHVTGSDDTLILLFMCAHPALSLSSQIALTLRAVGGLTTAEIARAFLVPEATISRRITRAKQTVTASHVPFRVPPADERQERLKAVQHALYLIFNEGYVATSGQNLHRVELTAEAIRLTRLLHRLIQQDVEVAGLLALMLLTDARRAARAAPDGALIPMARQDRGLWDERLITEGVALVTEAMRRGPVGPYQLQAAIAALHDESRDLEGTDWPQIHALYEVLLELDENPVVRLNHAVALAMVDGPRAGLEALSELEADPRIAGDHRLHAVRGHLLEMAGEKAEARESYLTAAKQATSLAQQRYLNGQAALLVS